MKTLTTINQLERYFPHHGFVLSYAEMHDTPELVWIFDRISHDRAYRDGEAYRVRFLATTRRHQLLPGCVLEFRFIVDDGRMHDYRYELIKKVDIPLEQDN